MRLLALLMSLLVMSCSPWRRADLSRDTPTELAVPDSLADTAPEFGAGNEAPLRAARWHLLRAQEAQATGLFAEAQQELDDAYQLLSALENGDADAGEATELGSAVERAYLRLLPRLERFSPDSPLVLLLEGLSEEKIDSLPPDATQLVRIHQLSPRCDMPVDANAKVAASIHFFQTRGRTTFETWMRRSGRFHDLIVGIMREEGVPEDLLYIAMIESGFNPRAYSRARAVGLWQFMEHTGSLQGLRRDHWVDERRDPLKSTRAAARHLKGLYEEFGDWRLAIAAYNAGRGRVARAVDKAGSRDFLRLELPRETENYVPLFMAASVIARDPAVFGFSLAEPEPPLAYDEVELPKGLAYVDLRAAARGMRVSYEVLRDLNPELRQSITPPGSRPYRLRVPRGKGAGFLDRYARLPSSEKLAVYRYEVQPRDNLYDIARTFGVKTQVIVDANSLRDPSRIYPGQSLYIPAVAGAAPGRSPRSQVSYTVRAGDSLSRIAANHGVRVSDLVSWNSLRSTTIRPGDRLTVRMPTASGPVAVAAAGTARPQARAAASDNGQPVHEVKPGETLWGLARDLGVSVSQLQEWNTLDGALIRPGQQLAVGPPIDEADAEHLYTVVRGDTLYGIAQRFGMRAPDLARHNNISLSSTLLDGMTLRLLPRSVD